MRRDPGHAGPNRDAMAIRRALEPNPFTSSWQQWGHIAAVHGSYSSTLAQDATPAHAPVPGDPVPAQTIDLAAAPSVNDLLVIGSFSSTLSSAAEAGATSVEMAAAPPTGLWLSFGEMFGSFGGSAMALLVSGTGPYTVTLSTGLAYDQASGAAVTGHPPAYLVTTVSGTTATIQELQSPWPAGTAVQALKTVDVYLDQSVWLGRNADGTPASTALTSCLRHGSWYSPAVGDYVLVGRSQMSAGGGSDRVVLGTLA